MDAKIFYVKNSNMEKNHVTKSKGDYSNISSWEHSWIIHNSKILILHYLNSLPAQVVHKHHEKKRHLQSSNFDLHRSNLTLEVMMRPPSKFRTDWKWFAFPINGWYHTTHSKKLLRCSFILLFDCCSRSLYLSSIFCWKSILPAVTCYYCLPVITKILILSFYVSFLINKP